MTELDIVHYIRKREGDGIFTDHKDDNGGATYTGVTLKTYNRWRVKNGESVITKEKYRELAKSGYLDEPVNIIYATEYIRPWTWLPDPLRFLMSSISVLSGMKQATRLLQRAAGVPDDGIVGPATKRAAGGFNVFELLLKVSHQRQLHYARIVQKNGSQAKWLGGWTNGTFKDLTSALESGGE